MFWRGQLFHHPATSASRPVVASSACLLGESVRYNGAHKLQEGIQRWLAPFLNLQALCPEVGIGLPVPRPPLKLIRHADAIRVAALEASEEKSDDEAMAVTDALHHYADQKLRSIDTSWPLCAWVFKARSPSCGYGSSPIDPGTDRETLGSGVVAARINAGAAWLPFFEENDLLTEQQCADMLLLCFLAQDILWQHADTEFAALQEHYLRVLGIQSYVPVNDRHGLWREVRELLKGPDNEKRRELLSQYRAAPAG